MEKDTRNRIIFSLLFSFLFLGYIFLIWGNFKTYLSGISTNFGYLDYQNNWRVLDDLINLKIPYKDYFSEYGWLFLFIQSTGYIIAGRNFLSLLISEHLYLPVIGIILSYIVAKNILGKKHLILIFLFFSLLFEVNNVYPSIRHLMAELSLSFFILYLFKEKNKYLLISGIIGGFAVLTALEYGIALNITILVVFIFSFFSDVKLKKDLFSKFYAGQLIVVVPYFFWLYIEGALRNYWEFTYGFSKAFYYASPCSGDSFPRLYDVQNLLPISKLLVLNIPIEFLQRLNFYIVFGFFLISALVLLFILIKNKKFSKNNLMKFSLVIYGLLVFLRTLDTPCIGYFTYGLVPFFLLITLFIEEIASWGLEKKSRILKIIAFSLIILIFSWFILTENTGSIVGIFGSEKKQIEKNNLPEQEFYFPAGWFVNKELADGYKEITDYIVKNTTENDFLYVYPWGPYNHLTGRRPPNSILSTHHFVAGEQFVERTKRELELKKPKFVVINIFNNLGVARYGTSRGDVGSYFSTGYDEGPVFAGDGNAVEKYILENYQAVFKNNLAIIMQQRAESIMMHPNKKIVFSRQNWTKENIELESMKETSQDKYIIVGDNASLSLIFETPVEASDIYIELKLDGNLLTKHLTRYVLNFYIQTTDASAPSYATKTLATKDWQTVKIPFGGSREIKILKIEVGSNNGLIWWLNPDTLEIRNVTAFK